MTTWTDDSIDTALNALNPVPRDRKGDPADHLGSVELLTRVLLDSGDLHRPVRHGDRQRRIRVTAAVAAGLLVVAVGVTVGNLGSASTHSPSINTKHPHTLDMSLVDFSTQANGNIVAQNTDADAAATQLDAVFVAHHLDISVTVLPVSPSLVGTIVYEDGSNFQPIHAGFCVAGGTQCTVGFIIPADFAGHADVAVGRAAHPGEAYQSADSSFCSGEALHCAGVFNQPVSVTAPIVTAKGLSVEWRIGNGSTNLSSAPVSGYVVDGIPISSNIVMLTVQPTPLAPGTPDLVDANAGC